MQKKFFFAIYLPHDIEVDGSFIAEDGHLVQVNVGKAASFEPLVISTPRADTEIIQNMICKLIERHYAEDIADTRRSERADQGPIRLGMRGL